jgi:hypothetical protein
MAREIVITGILRASGERTTLRVRAADERSAGWAAIEKGIEVLSIEPSGGRPAPTVPVSRPAPIPRPPVLARYPAWLTVPCLLLGLVLAATAAPVLPGAARDFGRVLAWADREREAVKAHTRYSDDDLDYPGKGGRTEWHKHLQRVHNTRNTFLAPLAWSAATVAVGLAMAVLSARSLALRRSRPPGGEPVVD